MPKSIGVGLIGTGYMGKCHALAWNAVRPVFGDAPPIHLAQLAEINPELAARKASEFGFARSTGNWRDLLADEEIDVISITTPNALHPEIAIAALQAGKHVWCEKPMAPRLDDALKMRESARKAGRIAIVGYNYIQNPLIRQAARFIADGAIGEANHIRLEVDEDFMADAEEPFYWKSEAASGYGALDDLAVHTLSLIWTLFGRIDSVLADMAKPYPDRPLAGGGRRAVESHDIASALFRLENGVSGVLMANRSAWGRKGRISLQAFGNGGSLLYDQERMNELQIYRAGGDKAEVGFRNILTGPAHEPYGKFVPAPGHSLGFNDLKVIECRQLISALAGEKAYIVDFERGVEIEQAIHAMARSFETKSWTKVKYD